MIGMRINVGMEEVQRQVLSSKISFEKDTGFYSVYIGGEETKVEKGYLLVGFAKEKVRVPIDKVEFDSYGRCIIHDAPIFLEGTWNSWKYSADVIKEMVNEYNSRPKKNMKCSIFTDHMDIVLCWIGHLENLVFDSKRKGAFATLVFSDADIVDKLKKQLTVGGGFWGLSPTIFVELDEDDYSKVTGCILESLGLVVKPAQGDKTMMDKDDKTNTGGNEMKKFKVGLNEDNPATGSPTAGDFEKQITATKERLTSMEAKLAAETEADNKELIQNEIDFLKTTLAQLEHARDLPDAKPVRREDESTAAMLPAPEGEFEDQGAGNYRKEVFRSGTFRDPRDPQNLFLSNKQRMEGWVKNFNDKAKDVPVPITHTEDESMSIGDVTKLELVGDSLFAEFNFPEKPVQNLIKSGKLNDVSIFVDLAYLDPKGKYWGETMDHICLTNNAQIPGLTGFKKLAMESIRHKYIAFEEVSPMKKEGDQDQNPQIAALTAEVAKLTELLSNALESNLALQERTLGLESVNDARDIAAFEGRIATLVKETKVPKGMEPRVTALFNSLRSNKVMFDGQNGKMPSAEEFVNILESLPTHRAFEDPRSIVQQSDPKNIRRVTKDDIAGMQKGEFAKLCKDGKIQQVAEMGGVAVWVDDK